MSSWAVDSIGGSNICSFSPHLCCLPRQLFVAKKDRILVRDSVWSAVLTYFELFIFWLSASQVFGNSDFESYIIVIIVWLSQGITVLSPSAEYVGVSEHFKPAEEDIPA